MALRPEIARRLAAAVPAVPPELFVRELNRASDGNFMYLTLVLADLMKEDGPLTVSALDAFLQGLYGYYRQFWEGMRKKYDSNEWETWDALYRPVIELLGVGASR